MQEDIERRTVVLSVNASKLKNRVLAKIFAAAMRKIQKEHQKAQTPQGRQSVKKLMSRGVSAKNIDLSGDTKLFDRVARKYNVDYAFHQSGLKNICFSLSRGKRTPLPPVLANTQNW